MQRRDLLKSSIATLGLLVVPGLALAVEMKSTKDIIFAEAAKMFDTMAFSEFSDVFEIALKLREFILPLKPDGGFIISSVFTENNGCRIEVMAADGRDIHGVCLLRVLTIACSHDGHEHDWDKAIEQFSIDEEHYVKSRLSSDTIKGQLRFDLVERYDFKKQSVSYSMDSCVSKCTAKAVKSKDIDFKNIEAETKGMWSLEQQSI